METIPLEPVERVELRALIDNSNDMLLRSEERAVRPALLAPGRAGGPRVEAPILIDPSLPEMLIAEHGFSMLVSVTVGQNHSTAEGGRATRQLMFDAGLSPGGLAHNLHALQIGIDDVEAIVLSHGHFDHNGGLNGLLKEFGARRLPMLLHPDFWLRRRITPPGIDPIEIPTASRGAIEGAGFEIIEDREPSLLLGGSVLITGEVARTTEFETGFPIHQAYRHDFWTPDPLIMDDQALIVNVRGRGLVVLTGCGHAGIVNIVRHAQALTGESRIAAIVGGFHLTPPLFSPIIAQTVAALQSFAPDMVVPGHCTGFEATMAIAAGLPEAFVANSVGTRYVVSSQ